MIDPYERCPVFENGAFLLRFIEPCDAPDLFLVYSDEKAVPYFNSDNCHGDDFHYTLLEHMQGAIQAWQGEYERKGFVRWTIVDKERCQAIGTIELFTRHAPDYFDDCAVLRLDLRSDYERMEPICSVLSLIVPQIFGLFCCRMIATKIPPFALERRGAFERLGFLASEERLIGHDGTAYGDYHVLFRKG